MRKGSESAALFRSPSATAGRACWKAKRGASKSGSRTGAAVVPMEELTGERPFPARLSGTMISDFQESCKADRQTSIHVPREGDDRCVKIVVLCNDISIHVPREGDDSKTAQRKNTLFVKVVQFCVKTKGK